MKKVISLSLCLVFLLLAVPNLNFAEKKASKFSLALLLNQPLQTLTSLFPFLSPIIKDKAGKTPSIGGVRPTGDSSIGKPGSGD